MRHPKTDYGTVILHWLFVAAFGVAFVSGMRIATEAPIANGSIFSTRPAKRECVDRAHAGGVAIVAVSLAYVIYLLHSGLARRVRLDQVRLRGMFGQGQTRLRAVNIVLYWFFFVSMTALLISGGLLYFGLFAGNDVAMLHWYGTWGIFVLVGLHVVTHVRLGGAAQLLRIFRPAQLSAPPPPLDAVELLTLLAEQSTRFTPDAREHGDRIHAHLEPSQNAGHRRPVKRDPTAMPRREQPPTSGVEAAKPDAAIQSPPGRRSRRHHRRLDHGRSRSPCGRSLADPPHLKRRCAGARRRHLRSRLAQRPAILADDQSGRQLRRQGRNPIEIRAVHDGTWAYFLFTWEDPTRSLEASAAGQGSRRLAPAAQRL